MHGAMVQIISGGKGLVTESVLCYIFFVTEEATSQALIKLDGFRKAWWQTDGPHQVKWQDDGN